MGEYLKIGENLYTNKKHHYIIKSCEYCESDFFCRKDKIKKKTCNPTCYQSLLERNNTYEITDYTNDIIIGSLLSDGCVNNTNNGKNYFWTQTCVNEDYINYLIDETNLDLHKFTKPSNKFISTNGKTYTAKKAFVFKSKASVTFTKYREDWYPNGVKIVPKNIKITPTVLLHWYLGDGYISDECGITLCTDSFDKESLTFLLYELENIGLLPHLNYLKNRIIIPNKRVIEFLTYIGECPVKSFDYKWNTFIKESYINRVCLNCGNKFTAICNHNKYCNPKCAILYSNRNGNNLKKKK
jgi:hypothetical protein